MAILLGLLYISPDRVKTVADVERIRGSKPREIHVMGDVEDYPPDVLAYLVEVLQPMLVEGATFERGHYRHPEFPL